ncbi:MAG: hypothetical protein ACYTFW_02095 [Planctomycetota bacterium]|jgi:hypothetical protein
MDKWTGNYKALAKYIKDPGLIFLGAIVLSGLAIIFRNKNPNYQHVLIAIVLGLIGLAAVGIYYRQQNNKKINSLDKELALLKRQLGDQPKVVTPKDYFDTLNEWNNSGPGSVLLYNIELQSFKDRQILQQTWGNLSKLENIKKVVLLLPEMKVKRWEGVVLKESRQSGFFTDKSNRKFDVCEVPYIGERNDRLKAGGIAFALYRKGDNPASGSLHPKVAIFVLSEPFSNLREPYTENDEPWWDYHHILIFGKDPKVSESAITIWNQYYDLSKTRNVDQVLKDVEPLKPISAENLFDQINLSSGRRAELLEHLNARTVGTETPRIISLDQPDGIFEIVYDNGETLCGHYSGIDSQGRKPRQALVCVGGFTEYRRTKLLEIFEKELQKEAVVQFIYEVSPAIEYATLTGYREDMCAVLNYVNSQTNIVISNELVLIARSINAFLAAMVGAEEKYIRMLKGVILVAPVFDIIEMMDNYRAIYGDRHVRVEKFWRQQPGYNDANEWECRTRDPEEPGKNWLNFFNHDVSLAVLADIIRQDDPEKFRLKSFIDYIGILSQQCPIYILSNRDDPVTGSKKAIEELENAARGSGKIRSEFFEHIEIQSSHNFKKSEHDYP